MKIFLKRYLVAVGAGALVSLTVIFGIARADSTPVVLANLQIPTSPEDTSSIDQRVAARIASYKVSLTASEKASLISKCVLAQSALTDVKAKDQKAEAQRLQTYSDLAKKMSYLVDNLSAQGVDASELLSSQNKFVVAINTYLLDVENYKAAMDDAINVGCQNEPEGFMASVDDARQLRGRARSDISSIKAQLPAINKALSDERQLVIKTPPVKPVVRGGLKH